MRWESVKYSVSHRTSGQRCRHFIGADTEWRRQVPSAHARDLYTMCTAVQCGPGDHGEQISYY